MPSSSFNIKTYSICTLLICTSFYQIVNSEIVGESSKFILNDPLPKFRSDDLSQLTAPLYIGSRVMDLMNGEHFDNILSDTPDKMRPPSIVLFYDPTNAQCKAKFDGMDYVDNVAYKLPSRGFLFAGKYDMNAAPKRLWYKWIPERDLVKRFDVKRCPELVWVPSKCSGETEWCVRETVDGVQYLGCDDFVEQCSDWVLFDGEFDGSENWIQWIDNLMSYNTTGPQIGGSRPGHVFGSLKEQEKWIRNRDKTTTRTQLRNNWAAASLPAFSEKGYKAVKMPDGLLKGYIDFYVKWRSKKADENWNSNGQTQVNGHQVAPHMTSLDHNYTFRDEVANNYIKPLLEEWVGFPLRLTSHYGEREYYSGSYLRNHIDRIDVLVISATSSILHITKEDAAKLFSGEINYIDNINTWPDEYKHSWPLEGIDWNGNNIRYDHEPGTIVLYESAKFVHGRPYPLGGDNLMHVGAFCHFVPADGSWAKMGHDKNARKNINRHTQNVRYTKEPIYYPPKNRHVEDHDEL